MKPKRLPNGFYTISVARLLPLFILLVTAGCDEKFDVSISRPDSNCDSYALTTRCTGNPVKLLPSRSAISSSVVVSGTYELR